MHSTSCLFFTLHRLFAFFFKVVSESMVSSVISGDSLVGRDVMFDFICNPSPMRSQLNSSILILSLLLLESMNSQGRALVTVVTI
jgi:hypothetical protein